MLDLQGGVEYFPGVLNSMQFKVHRKRQQVTSPELHRGYFIITLNCH